MKKIMKWLEENGIEVVEKKSSNWRDTHYAIYLEKNCEWINGYGESMKYDKYLMFYFDKGYKRYTLVEETGYMRGTTLRESTRADDIIKALAKRLNK